MNIRDLQYALVICITAALSSCDANDRQSATPTETVQHRDAHEDEHEANDPGEHSVRLTPAQLQRSSITLARIGPGMIREQLSMYGVVVANAERVQQVSARFPGLIRSVHKRVGDQVRRGETLASVESNESLETYAVLAPRAGAIMARNANPGEQAGDAPLFTIADLSSVWVEVALFPRDVARVRVGQKVRVVSEEAGLRGEGPIVYVSPFGDSASQTLTARVLLDNASRQWVPGLYVTADVALSEARAALTLRTEALQTIDGRSIVFIQRADVFQAMQVQLGRSDGERVELLGGAAAGQTYAAGNSFILKAELGKGEAEHAH